MIIVPSPSNRHKSGGPIHCDGRVSVPDFKMNSGYSIVSNPLKKVFQQLSANTLPAVVGEDGKQ